MGKQWKTMEAVVDSPELPSINAPLDNLRLEEKNLVINVCKSGRRRSVANKEAQFKVISTRMYNNEPRRVIMMDLQAETHWNHLCSTMLIAA